MSCCKSIFFSLLCPRGSSQVFSPFWFCVGGIRNRTRVFLFRFATPFLVPTILSTRPYHHQPLCIPSPNQLPWSLVLYYALTSICCLSRPCIEQQDFQWFHLFLWHTLQHPSWAYPLAAFHNLLSTICSSIIMIEDVFLPCKFWFNQRWRLSSCSW